MYYFPLADLTFVSPLSDEDIAGRIARNLEPQKMRYDHWVLAKEKTKLFEGTLFNNRFRMKRVENHASICNPLITGSIKQQVYNKSVITLKFRITGINAAVLFMGLLISSLIGIIGIANLFKDGQLQTFSLGCIGVWIAAYALTLWRFNAIMSKNVHDLSTFFEAQPDQFTTAESHH